MVSPSTEMNSGVFGTDAYRRRDATGATVCVASRETPSKREKGIDMHTIGSGLTIRKVVAAATLIASLAAGGSLIAANPSDTISSTATASQTQPAEDCEFQYIKPTQFHEGGC